MKSFKSFVCSCAAILALCAGSFQPASAQIYFGGSQVSGGTWTATYASGWTTTPTTTGHWVKVGRMCTLTILGALPTSNGTNFVITGIPAVCQAATAKNISVAASIIENNSVSGVTTPVDLSVGSNLQFFLNGNAAGGWTATGIKGINGSIAISYTLD